MVEILLNLGSKSRISPYSTGFVINTQNRLHFTIQKIWIHQSTFQTHTGTCIFSGTHDRSLKGFSFCYCLLGWHNHLQQDSRGICILHQTSFWKITECSLINGMQQMPFLHQRDPVPWTHPQHHRHQTATIKNSSHQQHAPTRNS